MSTIMITTVVSFAGHLNMKVGSYLVWNELLFSGGVQLTIIGTNLDLVERPMMNVSLIYSYGGVIVPNWTVTVRRQ